MRKLIAVLAFLVVVGLSPVASSLPGAGPTVAVAQGSGGGCMQKCYMADGWGYCTWANPLYEFNLYCIQGYKAGVPVCWQSIWPCGFPMPHYSTPEGQPMCATQTDNLADLEIGKFFDANGAIRDTWLRSEMDLVDVTRRLLSGSGDSTAVAVP